VLTNGMQKLSLQDDAARNTQRIRTEADLKYELD
jgi:hypothetical protein